MQGSDAQEEITTVRRSTRTAKPREMFTYNQFGQPSYQAWKPRANMMFACVPYPMPRFTAQPDMYYYPAPVWTC